MLRAWQDLIVKWRLVPDQPADEESEPERHFHRARAALLAGQLDEALAGFHQAAELRLHPHDHAGIGDVHLARGRWRKAAEHYQLAIDADPTNRVARLARSQILVAKGNASAAIPDLEHLVAEEPDDPVLRYYLASTWCSVGEQCRSQTRDEVLVITSDRQLRICERAASRILDLDVDDEELVRGAHRLLAEVAAGRRWSWAPEGVAASLSVFTVLLGLTMVLAGGVLQSVGLVVCGVVLGGLLLTLIVLRFRRQNWRLHAEDLAPRIAKHGVP
jgi:tetratricopeptide (TPR) repeat protein